MEGKKSRESNVKIEETWIIDRFARARERRQTFPINAGKGPGNVIVGVFCPLPLILLLFFFSSLSDTARTIGKREEGVARTKRGGGGSIRGPSIFIELQKKELARELRN